METTIIYILFVFVAIFALFLIYQSAKSDNKIKDMLERIAQNEIRLRNIKTVLMTKVPPSVNDLNTYKDLEGFEQEYLDTEVLQKELGQKFFNEATERALYGSFSWELREALINLYLLNKTKNIDHIQFYSLHQNLKNSEHDFAIMLKRMFEDEVTSYDTQKTYEKNFESFYNTCKTILEQQEDSKRMLQLLEHLRNTALPPKA